MMAVPMICMMLVHAYRVKDTVISTCYLVTSDFRPQVPFQFIIYLYISQFKMHAHYMTTTRSIRTILHELHVNLETLWRA